MPQQSGAKTATLPGRPADSVTTTLFISNIHCPSCIETIQESLSGLVPAPEFVSASIVSHSIVLRHSNALALDEITGSIEAAGFEVHSVFQDSTTSLAPVEILHQEKTTEWEDSLNHAVSRWLQHGSASSPRYASKDNMRARHVEQCKQCKEEDGGVLLETNSQDAYSLKQGPVVTTSKCSGEGATLDGSRSPEEKDLVVVDSASNLSVCKATISIQGMTGDACVNSVTHAVEQLPYVRSVHVDSITNSANVVFEGSRKIDGIVETIQDIGLGAVVDKLEQSDKWRATYSIGGMTCSVCIVNISEPLKKMDWVEKVDINLVSHSGTVVFTGKDHLPQIKEIIEDVGYEATLDGVVAEGKASQESKERVVGIRIEGMFCHHCPGNIVQQLEEKHGHHQAFKIEDSPFSQAEPILYIRYTPNPPAFTIRDIFRTIEEHNHNFNVSVYHPPTIEERARKMHAQERRRILFRLLLSAIIAIPTFLLGIVFMSLVKKSNPVRVYIMQPMWAGNATRLSWALFFLATPVYFLAADTFHRRALKELKSLWRPGSRYSMVHRLTRFGSMNMLMSLGTSIAYFASIAELALAATRNSTGSMDDSYFDAVVFLTMFLLVGRFLEAYSKAKTGDAVTSLGNLRPKETILVVPDQDDIKIATDLLEIGDTVRVHHGTSPPFDGTVVEGETTFDESSLTGESRPVKKETGDVVYSGTVNKGSPIKITVTSVAGSSMLDQIIDAVREGQTHRAPVERVADTITSHFVPFVVSVALITWVVWLVLGTTGALPRDWMGEGAGGWPLWSLRFAIAVFVVACPCGIGLAAPTALFVGGGLAAKHGVLVKGGGEAFQEASSLDCIVFDKTGTLTQGGDPAVTDHRLVGEHDRGEIIAVVKALEENSNHPIAGALVAFCAKETTAAPQVVTVEEIPGKGLKGTFKIGDGEVTVILGNETLMTDHNVVISTEEASSLETWKKRGESVALAAVLSQAQVEKAEVSNGTWTLAAIFAIADPLRPEAPAVISTLQKRGIDVWMLSGDNPITANAVAAQVGIPSSNVIAGVLPDQKAEKIRYLQRTLFKKPSSTIFRNPFSRFKQQTPKRATIAMVGDGINDAPALSTADLSIAIGSGSDIALSSSSFILINSHLSSILTLLDLSRVVFRRVYLNFGWALVYNTIAMPIAAGVLYPITTGQAKHPMDMHHNGIGMEGGMGMTNSGVTHIRLDPVWASLAMALSSVSVVSSSLALRSRIPGLGFVAKNVDELVQE